MLVLSAILMTATTAKAQTEHQTERDKISSVVMNLMNEWDHTAFQNATALIAQVANYDMNYLTAEGVMRLLGMKTAIEGTPDYRLLFSGNLFTGHFTVQNGAWVKESDANDLQLSYNAPNGVPCVLKMTTGGGVKTIDLPLEEDQLETLKDLVKSLTDKVGNDEGGSQSSAVTEAAMLLLKTYMDGVKMMTFEIPAQTSIELTYGGKQMMTSAIDVDLNTVGATVYDGLLMSANTKFYKGVLDNHGTGYFELNLVNSGYKPGTGINLDFTIGNDTKKCITVKANAPDTFKGFNFYQSNMSRRNEEMPFDIGFESLNVEVDVMGQAQLKGNVSNLNALILAMAAADDSDMESV